MAGAIGASVPGELSDISACPQQWIGCCSKPALDFRLTKLWRTASLWSPCCSAMVSFESSALGRAACDTAFSIASRRLPNSSSFAVSLLSLCSRALAMKVAKSLRLMSFSDLASAADQNSKKKRRLSLISIYSCTMPSDPSAVPTRRRAPQRCADALP